MNILREYTFDFIIKNKKSSIAIMIAIFIATVLMGSVCIYEYNMWTDKIQTNIIETGNWHGELFDDTKGKDIEYIKAHANVKTLMIKGDWQVAQIENDKRPYLIIRDADASYWENMPEKNSILEGNIPNKKGEIVVSKQFLAVHPKIQIGSNIELNTGGRFENKVKLDAESSYRANESFSIDSKKTYTIVGSLDVATSSVVPGYVAMGYLDESMILPDDDLVVYLQFENPRSIYEDLPQIAKEIGYQTDEFGEYLIKYNSGLLSKYFIFDKANTKFDIQNFVMPIGYIFIGIIIIGLFVFIINNAFNLSMQSRIKQLAMLKSVGATPKQIKNSVLFEALILSVIPILLGLFTSYEICRYLFNRLNILQASFEGYIPINFTFGWVVILGTVVMTLITVILSAYLPARKICKVMPIDILKRNTVKKLKKTKKDKERGIYSELAFSSFSANKSAFRTAIISLTLSYVLFMVFLNIISLGDLTRKFEYAEDNRYNINLWLSDGKIAEEEVLKSIGENTKVLDYSFYSSSFGTIWLTDSAESEEFNAIGGFKTISEMDKYNILERDKKYRVRTRILGLDKKTFKEYCDTLGIEAKDYYNENEFKSIVYNKVQDTVNTTRQNRIEIPFLDIKTDAILEFNEKTFDDYNGDYKTNIRVGAVVETSPKVDIAINQYNIVNIMPIEQYQNLVSKFENADKIPRRLETKIVMQVEENNIAEVVAELKAICDKFYGSEDYRTWDLETSKARDKMENKINYTIIYFISGLFAIIGISNAYTTIYGSIKQRKREYAVLRSIGMLSKGVNKLLFIESILFNSVPVLLAGGIAVVVQGIILKIAGYHWLEFIEFAPVKQIFIFIGFSSIAIVLAYIIGSHKILKENIVESVKDETV